MQLRAWCRPRESGFRFGLDDFATAVKAGRADVVAQMDFAGGRLHRDTGDDQGIVRAVHAALRGGFLVLLNCHGWLLVKVAAGEAAPSVNRMAQATVFAPKPSIIASGDICERTQCLGIFNCANLAKGLGRSLAASKSASATESFKSPGHV